jgi:hypothetical protein
VCSSIGCGPSTEGTRSRSNELHRDTIRTYIEEVFGGWDEAVQLAFHEQWMNRQRAQVIEVDGRLVGVVDTEWRDGELYLARIEVSPELQNLV